MSAHDDRKHLHQVKLSLTQREFIALCSAAGNEDRTASDMARVALRLYLFGRVSGAIQPCDNCCGPDEYPRVTE